MYTKYYGLAHKPFSIVPDPNTVYMSEGHQEALAILRYGVIDRKGFLMLTGGVGTGKTTLLQVLLKSMDSNIHVCLLANPTLSINDFYYYLAAKYGLREFEGNKAKFMLDFADFLKKCRRQKERVLLIIDEAHAMPVELLEEIRLLSNQEYQEYGVMSIFLVGQPELNEHLTHERLLPLLQRIGIRYHLQPFSWEDTGKYILFRLTRSGGQSAEIFTRQAIERIHEHSKGVPRLINIICDQALLSGFAEGSPVIEEEMIQQCIMDLNIYNSGNPPPPASKNAALSRSWLVLKNVLLTSLWLLIIVVIVMAALFVFWDINPIGIINKAGNWLLDFIFKLF